MSDGHRLAQLMREAGKTPQNEIVDIVMGVVTSVKPLKVKVENRELTESFLIVGALCKAKYIYTSNVVKFDHRHKAPDAATETGGSPPHTHAIKERDTDPVEPHDLDISIMLWRGLRVGDKVLMLKVGKGQKYYLMQREEGV